MNNFILRKLKIEHKNNILCDIKIVKDDYHGSNKPTTSIIIGNNSSGKSFILAVIAEFFDVLDSQKAITTLKYESYNLKYSYNGDNFNINIYNKNIIVYKNNIKKSIQEIQLPSKVLAVSYMLNDKFKFKNNNDSIYQYLGIRLTSNSSFTSTITNKVFDSFFTLITNKHFSALMDNISNFLDIDSKITFVITPKSKEFFTHPKSEQQIVNKLSKKIDYRYNHQINEIDSEQIIKFLTEINRKNKYVLKNDLQIYEYTITSTDDEERLNAIIKEYKIFKQLYTIGYIKSTDVILYKNNVPYPFENASSGEKHFIYEVTNIASKIENNSLILIDEPEISMHPNWQMKYISTLKNIFKDYASVHFIIATHSHYIVSDLEPTSSSLIAITYNPVTKERQTEILDYSTYAWSAENILYNVFGVRTTRNYYFEMDMRTLLDIVGKRKYQEFDYARILIKKLKKYIYDQTDPLCQIIDTAEELVNNDKTN